MIGRHWIAMLDILGFRQMVETRNLNELVRVVDNLFIASQPRESVLVSQSGERRTTLGHLHFSDTIMLWTPRLDTDESAFNGHAFFHLCGTVNNLIALALVNGVALRGGLAMGECYLDHAKQLAVGKAIINAYLLEQEQEWLGAAVAGEQLGELAVFNDFEDWSGLVSYPVPTKTSSSRALFALDWTHIARLPDKVSQKLWNMNARAATEQALSIGLAAARHEAAYRKWKNAAEFFQHQSRRRPFNFREIHVPVREISKPKKPK
jgi:hypothetical protein